MELNQYYVNVIVNLHLKLPVKAETKPQALEYFKSILRPEIIDLIEMDIHTDQAKTHIVNVTEGIRIDYLDVQGEDDL